MDKKTKLIEMLNEQLRKGELKDASIITKVELADPKLINLYLEKTEALRKSQENDQDASKEDAGDDQAE